MGERLIIEDFEQFGGMHCETAALKNILGHHGLFLSEEMLLGLGGGIGFIYWYMKLMPCPFIGTRNGKGGELLAKASQRIGAKTEILHTSSSKKGYEELKTLLRSGEPVICFGDMAYLPYFAVPEEAHFGAHTFVVFGIDEENGEVYISDLGKNPVAVTIEDLKKARNSKFPPFPPKNRLLKIEYPSRIGDLKEGIREGIKECCKNMLEPPIKNFGLAGIKKWAGLVMRWPEEFKGVSLYGCLFNLFIYIEIGGTGGSSFRPMYARFLRESSSILSEPQLNEVAHMFEASARLWSEIATASLPDSYPTLKRVRELSFEKKRIFEQQPPGALEKMREINVELDDLMKEAAGNFQKNVPVGLLANLRKKILECYEIEGEAFEELAKIIR